MSNMENHTKYTPHNNSSSCHTAQASRGWGQGMDASMALSLDFSDLCEDAEAEDPAAMFPGFETIVRRSLYLGPDELFTMAMEYASGIGQPKNEFLARFLLRKSAEKGGIRATMYLAYDCLGSGKIEEGRKYLHDALEKGHAEAAHDLADSYYREDGNVDAAIRYWHEGAERGNVRCAQRLAFIHEIGQLGQQASTDEADKYFWMAGLSQLATKPAPHHSAKRRDGKSLLAKKLCFWKKEA